VAWTAVAQAVDFRAWNRRLEITFAGYGRDETLNDVPLLVVFGPHISKFSYGQFASGTGGDLRFYDADGTRELPYEVDRWDATSNSFVWVQAPALSGATTRVWALWGRPDATNPPAYTTDGSVWSNRYVAVWHLTDTNAPDSASGAHHSTPNGSLTTRIDPDSIGASVEFPGAAGSNAYIRVTDADDLDGHTAMTLSLRYRRLGKGAGGAGQLISKLDYLNPPADQYVYRINHFPPDEDKKYYYEFGPPANAYGQSVGEAVKNPWNHLTLIYDGSVSNASVYIDGRLDSVTNGYDAAVGTSAEHLYIGNNHHATNALHGILDEVRIASVSRSSNWIWATWMNMASNAVFNSYGTVQRTKTGTMFSYR
jgi:hypothetical protein